MIETHVAIIGAGPGGLMAAYLLQRRAAQPLSVTLYEASPRVGGKILTCQFQRAAVSYEAGAAELYDYSQLGPDPLKDLIAELGLSCRTVVGEHVILDEKILHGPADVTHGFSRATMAALANFRRQARAAISPQEYYESDWRADNADPLSRETFYELLARVPDDTARRYIQLVSHSDLACEPAQTSAMYGLQNYLMDEPDYMKLYTIEGGIERLPEALARRLSARILLNHEVERVGRADDSRYLVTARHGGKKVEQTFDYVVVALPNNWIPAVEWGGAKLSSAMHEHHKFYNHPAHYLRVTLLFKTPFWREWIDRSFFMLDAFGGCCVYDETGRYDGETHGALGWLIAGDDAVNLCNASDAELIQRMLSSLPAPLNIGAQYFVEGRVHRWVGAVNAWPAGCPAREPDSRHVPEPIEHPGIFVVGDYLFDSTLNGVLDSADLVSSWIVEEMVPNPTS